MKIREYSYQTGDCPVHDTGAIIRGDDMRQEVLELIDAKTGAVPGLDDIIYTFMGGSEDIACLAVSRSNYVPILSSMIITYDKDTDIALTMMNGMTDQYRQSGYPMRCKLPDAIITPCLITYFMPGLTQLTDDALRMLEGLPRDYAAVWLERKFGG